MNTILTISPLLTQEMYIPFITLMLTIFLIYLLLNYWLTPGGYAWKKHNMTHFPQLKGPLGWPILGSLPIMGPQAHRKLAQIAATLGTTRLMALSLGTTPLIISSHPETAKEILCSPAFSDRPVKSSARLLMFERAIGFAPGSGAHWRRLRRLAATHFFSPRSILGLAGARGCLADAMLRSVTEQMDRTRVVQLRGVLQEGSLRNMLESVFGGNLGNEGEKLGMMVKEGYELISEFNLEDYFHLGFLDFNGVKRRCVKLSSKVNELLEHVIEVRKKDVDVGNRHDFLSVLLSLPKEEQLGLSDMIAVLWEMVFRGSDTVAILLEWAMARLVLHQDIQQKAQQELDSLIGSNRQVQDSDIQNLPYLRSIVKEVLRLHPPGPLLSWARLAVHDVYVDQVKVPAGTTAMVNMWAITHDPALWTDPWLFNPDRFMDQDVSIMGSDLRLAPFGSGRRVCPGRALGLATVHLWLARMVHQFRWVPARPVDLSDCLRLSLEMKKPLVCFAVARGINKVD